MSDDKFNDAHFNSLAEELVRQLPDHIGEQIIKLGEEFRVPLWQMVCGILLDCYQLGRLSAFQLDPAWKDGYRNKDYICQRCGAGFEAKRINQTYCSETCGTAALNSQLGKLKEAANERPIVKQPQPTPDDPSLAADSDGSDPPAETDVLSVLDSFAALGGVEAEATTDRAQPDSGSAESSAS